MSEDANHHDHSGRYHVNDHGGGSYYIDHLPCTDDHCRREHHYLFTVEHLSDFIHEYVIARAADNGTRVVYDGSAYDISRVDDAARAKHERSCPYSCPHADYFRGREEKSSGNRG